MSCAARSRLLLALLLLAPGCVLLTGPRERPPSSERVEPTPARLERGRYLVEHVTACLSCHSERDWRRYVAPIVPGTEGRGGTCFTPETGFPGHLCTQNLTPSPEGGLVAWTDGELMRAIRERVGRDGRALFPTMPYSSYARMSDEDTRAVVAYLRSLPARPGAQPPVRVRFPVSLFIRAAPRPLEGPVPPPPDDSVERGRYLAALGGCDHCHTLRKRGDVVEGMEYAGGVLHQGPWGRVVASNLTPDLETGLGGYTREAFVARFRAFQDFDASTPAPPAGATPMPWTALSRMTDEDLRALYDFLRTLRPVRNAVVPFAPVAGARPPPPPAGPGAGARP